jgi:hypothetical protein
MQNGCQYTSGGRSTGVVSSTFGAVLLSFLQHKANHFEIAQPVNIAKEKENAMVKRNGFRRNFAPE